MEETGKKSAEESESLYVGSSALSSGASYLIVTSLSCSIIVYTVEPPNRGHFGTAIFVLSSEVVLFSEVVLYLP